MKRSVRAERAKRFVGTSGSEGRVVEEFEGMVESTDL